MKVSELMEQLRAANPEKDVRVISGVKEIPILHANTHPETFEFIIQVEMPGRSQALKMMMSWLSVRSPVPKKSEITGQPYIEDSMTTDEIVDSLSNMGSFNAEIVDTMLYLSGYDFTHISDGTVKWLIYRDFNPII